MSVGREINKTSNIFQYFVQSYNNIELPKVQHVFYVLAQAFLNLTIRVKTKLRVGFVYFAQAFWTIVVRKTGNNVCKRVTQI